MPSGFSHAVAGIGVFSPDSNAKTRSFLIPCRIGNLVVEMRVSSSWILVVDE
jgi:hypothetical protein